MIANIWWGFQVLAVIGYAVLIVTVLAIWGRFWPCSMGFHYLPLAPGEIGRNYRCATCGAYFHWDQQSCKWWRGKEPESCEKRWTDDSRAYQARLQARF